MKSEFVDRTFDADYIYFDILFLCVWILFLIIRKKKLALLWSFIGLIVYYIVDYGIWYSWQGTRRTNCFVNPALLMFWVSSTPGVVHPSWVVMMFELTFHKERSNNGSSGDNGQSTDSSKEGSFNEIEHGKQRENSEERTRQRILWTILFFSVQTIPAFMQKGFDWDNRTCKIGRHMGGNRWKMLLSLVIGYGYLCWRRIKAKDLVKLFLIGFIGEGIFEFAFYISGIRTGKIDVLLFDSAIEMNLGIPWMFLLWRWMLKKDKRPYYDEQYNIVNWYNSFKSWVTCSKTKSKNFDLPKVSSSDSEEINLNNNQNNLDIEQQSSSSHDIYNQDSSSDSEFN
ncbi:hypothetical protein M0813_04114 [Anaeramoeba flamelloides]|uniref:Transmembrane protein n=1 Tax=Anaeramoeba flamelloides TaxID=1746091 RepID=A0ABQ8XNX1_9EUKA|nr:hypothetical protein M0813_04114 [Anaeramoeba flamelloides]